MKFSTATVIRTRDDFLPTPTLLKVNGRYYTAFGRLFAVRGDHINCTEEEYRDLCYGVRYQFTSWGNYSGIYKEED